VSISIDMARRIAEACKQRARELLSPVSIAIVDAGGHLVFFERMMSPYGWVTGDISIAKATTAVMFNQPTDAVAQWGASIPGFASSLSSMTHGKFIMAAGGWPIRIGGATIGGIGISGGNAPGRDDDIARAGLASIDATPVQPGATPNQAYYTGALTAPPVASYPNPQPPDSRSAQPTNQVRPRGEVLNNNGNNYSAQITPDQDNNAYGNTADKPVSDQSGE
jgi:uncharacterized protein GlcG (DUF336 family)